LAGDVLPIHDPGHFAIGSDLFLVVVAAVVGDLEDFVSEVFRLTLARKNIQVAKFLIASEPAEYRGSSRHRGIGTDGPQAFTWRSELMRAALDGLEGRGRSSGIMVDLWYGQPR
jgi:hypothetical protein